MVLVDTSVWIDHLRGGDAALADLLVDGKVLTHPFIVGEIAMGSLHQRRLVLTEIQGLPVANVAEHNEVMGMVERDALFGQGIGYIDVHLLAAVRLTPDATLWTRDRCLRSIAQRLVVSAVTLH